MKNARIMLAAALVCAGCAHQRLKLGKTADGEVIEAEGWSPYDPKDLLADKRRSLAEAEKKAVEQVVGVYISAKTRVAQAVAVDQNILANVGGYVKSYEVEKEWQEDGFYKTKIRAYVLYKKVGEDLKGLGLVRPEAPPGNPRVVVSLAPEPGADASESPAAGGARRAFVERGFQVVDKAAGGAPPAGDILVTGQASARELTDVQLGGFHSWRARVELQAARAGTGEVVSRKTQEASALDPTPDIARAKALDIAGGMAGEALAEELSQVLTSRVTVTLRVDGLKGGLAAVQSLAQELRDQPDIAEATLDDYGPDGASLKVTTEGFTGDQLAAMLLRMRKYAFDVRSVTPYLVEVALGEGGAAH